MFNNVTEKDKDPEELDRIKVGFVLPSRLCDRLLHDS